MLHHMVRREEAQTLYVCSSHSYKQVYKYTCSRNYHCSKPKCLLFQSPKFSLLHVTNPFLDKFLKLQCRLQLELELQGSNSAFSFLLPRNSFFFQKLLIIYKKSSARQRCQQHWHPSWARLELHDKCFNNLPVCCLSPFNALL